MTEWGTMISKKHSLYVIFEGREDTKTKEHKRICGECLDRWLDNREREPSCTVQGLCQGCEQNIGNFDFIVGMNEDRFIAKINTAE